MGHPGLPDDVALTRAGNCVKKNVETAAFGYPAEARWNEEESRLCIAFSTSN
jgi:hypothetical protein